MGLGDMVDNAEEEEQSWVDEQKQDKVDDMASQLGIESKEDLEELDTRLEHVSKMATSYEKKLRELEEQVEDMKKILVMFGSDLMDTRRELGMIEVGEFEEDKDDNDRDEYTWT